MRTYVTEKKTIVPIRRFDPVEAEAERQWTQREIEFHRIYPSCHMVKWEDAKGKARDLMLAKAKKELLQKGVAI